MAVALGQRADGHTRRFRPMSDINVTPMVDVMLVLLVIFMVTAPLLTASVLVDLPKTADAPHKGEDQPLSVTVDALGRIWVQENEVMLEELAERLRAATAHQPEIRIFVRGDRSIDYGRVMEVIAALGASGFSKVALVTEIAGADAPAGTGSR